MYVAMYVILRSRYQPYHAGHIYFMCGIYIYVHTYMLATLLNKDIYVASLLFYN